MCSKKKVIAFMLMFTLIATLLPSQVFVYAQEVANTEKVLLFQDFNNNIATTTSSGWEIVSGSFEFGGEKQGLYTDSGGTEALIFTNGITSDNYTVEATINTQGLNCFPWIMGRAQDSKNCYALAIVENNSNTIQFNKIVGGTSTTLATRSKTDYPISAYTDYTIKMVFEDSKITCYMNGDLLFEVIDSTYSTGKVGIRNKWSGVLVDDVQITTRESSVSTYLEASGSQDDIILNWSDVGAYTYQVLRSSKQEGKYSVIAEAASTSYIDNSTAFGREHFYKIKTTGLAQELILGPISGNRVEEWQEPSEEDIRDNDYLMYYVDAGDKTPSIIENESEHFGVYNRVTEQPYGKDAVTGKMWGYLTQDTTPSALPTSIGGRGESEGYKERSLRVINDSAAKALGTRQAHEGLHYLFELPEGTYEVTIGMGLPGWTPRNVDIKINNMEVESNVALPSVAWSAWTSWKSTQMIEKNYIVELEADKSLALDILDHAVTASDQTDAVVNYILIKQKTAITKNQLEALIEEAIQKVDTGIYTEDSCNNLQITIDLTEEVVDNYSSYTILELQETYTVLKEAIAKLTEIKSSIISAVPWVDTNGERIQAHGGGMWYDETTQTYYWYGEDKTYGYRPLRGVRCYSSKDLYNWKDEGLALTAIQSMDEFTQEGLVKDLYEDRKDKAAIFKDLDVNTAVMERPKVIYNESTGKWVLWFHADGPTETSAANYAKASAGVAIADSPVGPFTYISSYRLDQHPSYTGNKGMARDMNLFVDDDGTGYIIYSSEENATMFISKLTEDYLDVVGWHKEGKAERDSVYKGQEGIDYVRIFPNESREAPAMFKYDGKYYLMTSGCTGWAPNPARYAMADNVLGTWTDKGDPCINDTGKNTFKSQSTYIVPIDREAGKYMYMGDRWYYTENNGGTNSDSETNGNLKDSRYIWLPIQFHSNDTISLSWHDQWELSLLDAMGKITIKTEIPQVTSFGIKPELPTRITIEQGGIQKEAAVIWKVNENTFKTIGNIEIAGQLETGESVVFTLCVVPKDVVYFVNCGTNLSADYSQIKALIGDTLINKEVNDQALQEDMMTHTWGYTGTTNTTGSGNIYESMRYIPKTATERNITYTFNQLEAGTYKVYTGFYDPWYQYSKGIRKANIFVNDDIVQSSLVIDGGYKTYEYANITVEDTLKVDIRPVNTGDSTDVQVSFIMIAKSEDTGEDDSFVSTNVALGRPVTVSSYEKNNVSQYVNDGDMNTRWCASDGTQSQFIEIDLQKEQIIDKAQIEWEGNKIYKYVVEASLDGNIWTTLVDQTNNDTATQSPEHSFKATKLRYIRLRTTALASATWASVYEFRVFNSNATDVVELPVAKLGGVNYYVDSVIGDDTYDGESETTAWKTLDKVNNRKFLPGDRILFKAGGSWIGQLILRGSGNEKAPIIVDQYGEGNRPIINGAGATNAVYIANEQYWEINNLEITNKGSAVAQRRGIGVLASKAGTFNHIYIRNCYIHDVNGADAVETVTQNGFTMDVKHTGGIIVMVRAEASAKTNFNDVRIENNIVRNVDRTGIRAVESGWFNRDNGTDTYWAGNTNIVIRGNVVDNIGGDGIVAQTADKPLVEYNVAKDCNSRSSVANVAIWEWSCKDALFQYNEAYLTRGTKDGQGYDCDYYSTGTTFQYNYSHDNEGGFMLVCSPEASTINYDSVIRYNISENDKTRGIQFMGAGTKGTKVYNNVIYVENGEDCPYIVKDSPEKDTGTSWGTKAKDANFYNNIFYVKNGTSTVDDKSDWIYANNCYYNVTVPAEDTQAIVADPLFVNPGNVGQLFDAASYMGETTTPISAWDKNHFSGYKLQENSPCIDKGREIENIDIDKDFFGNSLYTNMPDIGIHEVAKQVVIEKPNKPQISHTPQSETDKVTVIITKDIANGGNILEYKVNDSDAWQVYTETFVINENMTITARAKDDAGNISEEVSIDITNIKKVSGGDSPSNPGNGDGSDSPSNPGNGNNNGGGSSSSTTAPTPAETLMTIDAKLVATMPIVKDTKIISVDSTKGITGVVLPIDSLNEIQKGQSKARIEIGDATITIPLEVLDKSLLEGAKNIIIRETTSGKEQDKVINSNKAYKMLSNGYTFKVEVVKENSGEPIILKDFKAPISVKIKLTEDEKKNITDKRKIGIYDLSDKNNPKFLGGKLIEEGIEIQTYSLTQYAIMSYSKTFEDLDQVAWAKENIEVLASRHITSGKTATIFDPNGLVTRAELAVFLGKAIGIETKANDGRFNDVNDENWYSGYVMALSELGLLQGYSEGDFRPDQQITRQEMAVLITKAYTYFMQQEIEEIQDYGTISFIDIEEVAAWAVPSVRAAKAIGLINGSGDNKFLPDETATRAEMATILVGLLGKLEQF